MADSGNPGKEGRTGWRRILLHRWTRRIAFIALGMIVLWSVRRPILRSVGQFLIREDELLHADELYVLGGSPIERTIEGLKLVRSGYANSMTFTGGSPDEDLLLFGIDTCEGGLGARVAHLSGFDSTRIHVLRKGTSTWEEAEAVREWALANAQDTIMVVTTEFHTRRVGNVFRKAMGTSGITVIVRAAPSIHYDPDRWWRSEEGLIMVNNEYAKLIYYAFRR